MALLVSYPGALAIVVLLIAAIQRLRRKSHLALPPGPPPLPLIGNVLDLPRKDMASGFRDLSRMYGDVVYLDVLGQPMIILGSHEAALDLLDKRSANYSDRPASPMADIAGFSWAVSVQRYGSWWRRHRRNLHQYFVHKVIKRYEPCQRLEAHRFAYRLLENPGDLFHSIRHLFGSSIMRFSYGIEVDEEEIDYIKMAEDVLAQAAVIFVPGRYLVDIFPILRFIPEWVPGVPFRSEGKVATEMTGRLVRTPWKEVTDRLKLGTARPSMATALMERLVQLPPGDDAVEEEEVARNATAMAYAGGADTTVSTVQTFFLAMALYPDVQAKAQAELDAIVGSQRLPEFHDEDALPYICALVKELLRWRSVVPFGVPHRSLEDDEYRGYLIPKGSIVISNLWAYSRDPKHYPDPERFMPERWLKDGRLDPDMLDSSTIAFGYGRRICPGRHFAQSALFIVVATIMHTLTISAPKDEQGHAIPLSGKMTDGVLSYPEPFECDIKSRSADAEALVRAAAKEAVELSRTRTS